MTNGNIVFCSLARLQLIQKEIETLFITQNRFPDLGVTCKPEQVSAINPPERETQEEQSFQCFTNYSVENSNSSSNGDNI